MDATQTDNEEELKVHVVSTTLQHRTRSISIKLTAPLTLFTLPDALAQHGALQPLDEFLTHQVREGVDQYLVKAQELIARVSEKGRQRAQGK